MNYIYIENPYLNYIIFGSHISKYRERFPKLVPHVNSFSNKLNALYLLQNLVSLSFNEYFPINYLYEEKVVNDIWNNPSFQREVPKIKKDILRIYDETQTTLSNSESERCITLFRRLPGFQLPNLHDALNFKIGDNIRIPNNYLNCFHTEQCAPGLVEIKIQIPIEKILFWENLAPRPDLESYSGLILEHECIVKLTKSDFMAEITNVDYSSIKQCIFINEGRY